MQLASETRILLDNSLDAVIGADQDGHIIYWNKQAEDIFGRPAATVLGKEMADYIMPERFREMHRAGMKRYIDTGVAHILNKRIEIPAQHASGKEFPVELTVSAFKHGSELMFYSFLRDLTKQKEIQSALEQSRKELEELADTMTQLAWIAAPDGSRVWFNKRWYEYTGTDFDDVKGFGWQTLHQPERKEEFLSEMAELFKKAQPWELTFPLRSASGTYRWFLTRVVPLKNADGTVVRWFGTNTDITEQRESEEALRVAKELAESANKLKTAFLANMSHEIRTPLGAILGFADLLKDPAVFEAERHNYLDIIHRNGEQLTGIVNDVLDLSKIEAGGIAFEIKKINAKTLIEDVAASMELNAKEKNLVLKLNFDSNLPATICTDPSRLKQMLLNVVSNAIKFTPQGIVDIHVSYKRLAPTDTLNSFIIDVTDSGIGMTTEQASRLFQPFSQADESITRKFGGTGLGLALSRKLAEALGGDVELKTTSPGAGSTFRIRIADHPRGEVDFSRSAGTPETSRSPSERANLDGVRILLVDDSVDNQYLITKILNKHKMIVDVASDGLEGFKKGLSGNYSLVLMDVQMPVMDGYTATEKLREAGFDRPIIALTAHVLNEVRKKCLSVGCSDHLSKPINAKELISTISRYIQ